MLDECKRENNRVSGGAGPSNTIAFTNNNQFIYDKNNKVVYFSNDYKYFIVAKNIESIVSPDDDLIFKINSDKSFSIKVKISGKEYSQDFTMGNN